MWPKAAYYHAYGNLFLMLHEIFGLGRKILVDFSKNQMNYFLFIILAIFYSLAKTFKFLNIKNSK